MSIYSAELVCSNNHMIAGMAGDYENDKAAKVLVRLLTEHVKGNPEVPSRCNVCGRPPVNIVLAQVECSTVKDFYDTAVNDGHTTTVLSRESLNARNN